MERIEKIRSIINNWRQKFKTGSKTKYITSRQANRKFLNMLKGRRNITRWHRRKRRTNYSRNLYHVSPSAPPMITPTAPPMYVFSDHNMPH